jgi:type I restriction enzyme, S subunit
MRVLSPNGFENRYDVLQTEVDTLKHLQAETVADLYALLPSMLDKAFKGEL